jgi:di/tricarboxylate transporter
MALTVAKSRIPALQPFKRSWQDLWRSAWRPVVPIAVGLAIVILPPPLGLSHGAWHYFALFAAVILGLVLEPLPSAAVGVLGVTSGS